MRNTQSLSQLLASVRHGKRMMYKINVSEKTATLRKAGEMVTEINEGATGKSAFRYEEPFRVSDTGFPLDPVSIPLNSHTSTTGHHCIFGVFEDSLPDDWGRRILIRQNSIPRHQQNLPQLLLALGDSGLGALSYSSDNAKTASNEASVLQLSSLLHAAEMFERGDIIDPAINALLGACSSPGGARPKANKLVHAEHQVGSTVSGSFP